MHACVLLDLESSGGRNVFGPIPSSGCGQPRGSAVTDETYAQYLGRRNECGGQGVGPLQLTWPPLQDIADQRGGCWDPRINVRVGLELFADHLSRTDDVRDAYSAYNTGRTGESTYATKALGLILGWQRVIDGP